MIFFVYRNFLFIKKLQIKNPFDCYLVTFIHKLSEHIQTFFSPFHSINKKGGTLMLHHFPKI